MLLIDLINLVAVGGINTSLFNVSIMIMLLVCYCLALSCLLSMVGFFETESYWQGGFTEEQKYYYKEHRLSQKGKHLWEQIDKLYTIARNVCPTYNVTY